MISVSRRLNFTNRRKIKREHATITVRTGHDRSPPTFDAALDLDEYNLPESGCVFVEAHRHTAFQRFDFGTVGQLRTPEKRELHEFGEGEGVQFRIKVVEAPESGEGRAARILAHADITPDQAGRRRSLLPIEAGDFRDEVWKLEIDGESLPVIQVSKHLEPDRHGLVKSHAFVSLALPEVLRRILTEATRSGLPDNEDDWESWRGKWVRVACGITGASRPPSDLEEEGADIDGWIDEVVSRFCRQHKIALEYQHLREGS